MLSREDIKRAIVDGRVKIYPFESKNMTGIGYNLSTTNFAFSISRGILLAIRKDTTPNGVSHYVLIPPCDTVLFFSKEYVSVDGTLAGSFHSKVSRVCQGLGHVSTTLDPTWKGQLILSVNNPTNREMRFDLDKESGNVVTMLLHELDTPVSGPNVHDNNRGRCDMLLSHFSEPPRLGRNRGKHLELQSFVVGQYADSLNGYDNFLDDGELQDRYSKNVEELRALQSRLKQDVLLMRECRYPMSADGRYFALRSSSERRLIKGCALYGLFDEERLAKLVSVGGGFEGATDCGPETVEEIESYLSVIDYELEMINHIRRVNWQNEKVHEYADERSALSKEQKHAQIRAKVWGIAGYIVAAAILFVAAACIIQQGMFGESPMMSLACAVIAAFISLVIAAFGRWNDLASKQADGRGRK